jgi:hypothetical protein
MSNAFLTTRKEGRLKAMKQRELEPESAKASPELFTFDWDGWFSTGFYDHFRPAIDEVIKMLGEECGLIEKRINDKLAELDARITAAEEDPSHRWRHQARHRIAG